MFTTTCTAASTSFDPGWIDKLCFTSSPASLTLRGMNDARVDNRAETSDVASMEAQAAQARAIDAGLMLAYAQGDVSAFEQLYSRYRGRLHRFLQRQLRNTALADEFFQDVWQRVIAARQTWTPDAAFSTWLFRIAHNRLNDHWRAQQHRPAAPDDADERTARVPDPHTPERTLSEFEQRRRLQMALDELPEEQRIVVTLRLEQELTLEEIGLITGVGRETVKSRLRYAMDKLRTRLQE